jgi:cell division protein FtsA
MAGITGNGARGNRTTDKKKPSKIDIMQNPLEGGSGKADFVYPLIFGLDIGTRSIVGTVGYRKGDHFYVVAQAVQEHMSRAMMDGQIHDIGKVGETIHQVKERLEDELGHGLSDVCIAAAGRVLRTVTTYAEVDFGASREVTQEDVYSLATLGVEKAYEEFVTTNDSDIKFYCVGYTPMRYYMNGYPIGNLEGHKAKTIGTDLIATFLPDDVVDGLYKAVEAADLKVVNLTLEPIAAMQVAIPEKYRMLNMALVDVGAGTSDISLTKGGAIIAYGMIPVAGDSLTELIVQHCLVDFDTAEMIKRQSGDKDIVEYTDIMGLPQTIASSEVLNLLEDSICHMTKMVADCIKELNGDKPVSAVFVVGGGGMIPGYTEHLARELGIPKERVAIRGEEVMQMITFEKENARKDSLMVTPIGICLCYYEQGNHFIFVMFNNLRLKMFDNGNLTLADAAIQAQFPNDALFPKRGEALVFTVDGKSRMIRGQQGEAAVITMNEETADIHTKVHNGDRIRVVPSTAGESASITLGKLSEMSDDLTIIVNGSAIKLPKTASVNGEPAANSYEIKSGDVVLVHNYYTVAQIARFMDVPLQEGLSILVNDTPAKPETNVYENFTVTWDFRQVRFDENVDPSWREMTAASAPSRNGEMEAKPYGTSLDSGYESSDTAGMRSDYSEWSANSDFDTSDEGGYTHNNGDNLQEGGYSRKTGGSDRRSRYGTSRTEGQAQEASTKETTEPKRITVVVNRQPITLTGKAAYVFVDIFEFYPFDLHNAKGKSIVAQLNGRAAEYLEKIHDGDVIEIYWRT